MSKEELQKCSKEYLIKIIDDISRENIKIIDENQAIKNIKYTVEETIYKTRWNSLREWLEKQKHDTEICKEWNRKNNFNDIDYDRDVKRFDFVLNKMNELEGKVKERMKKYRVVNIDGSFGLFLDEEYEGEDSVDIKEQIMEEIMDNIGNYLDIELEEIDDELEGE